MMNHNELNALQYIVMSMERVKTITRVIMNWIEGYQSILRLIMSTARTEKKHNYDYLSPFLHRRTKLSQGWTSLCAPAPPVLWEKTSCSSMMLTSSIWILWSKKGVQPSLPYRQSSSGLLWCCRKKSNEWTIWYVEYKQNKSEVLLKILQSSSGPRASGSRFWHVSVLT